MKICNVDDCNNFVFGKGYCKNHQYLRTDIKKTINKVSPKRILENEKYFTVTKKLKDESTSCWICDREFMDYDIKDCHHVKGRDGELLTNKKYLVIVHRDCHNDIHNLSKSKLIVKQWFKSYIYKLNKILNE